MTIKQLGGVFGRNPTFNDVTIEGTLTFDGALDINSDINLPDNKKITFGDAEDLQIYSDGSKSTIKESGAGSLVIEATNINLKDDTGTDFTARFITGDAVQLYYNGGQKLATTNTGIDVTGTVTTDDIYVGAGSATSPSVQMNDTNSGLFAPAGNTIAFSTAGGERVRIDSSGSLLVGTTSDSVISNGFKALSDGRTRLVRTDGPPLVASRLNSDGDVAYWQKDGTTVGNIGVTDGDLNIYSSATSHGGLRFGNGWVAPTDNAGTLSDGAIDLGLSSGRFQDLWLSGGVYLGGTGAANKLDDYEEGTFTPVVSDAATDGNTATYATNDGYYTKVGNLVQATIYLVNIDTTGMTGANNVYIQGLPFSQGSAIDIGSIRINSTTFSGSPVLQADSGYCVVQLSASGSAASYLTVAGLSSGAADIIATITYRTA